jgi:hypothetical protein
MVCEKEVEKENVIIDKGGLRGRRFFKVCPFCIYLYILPFQTYITVKIKALKYLMALQ